MGLRTKLSGLIGGGTGAYRAVYRGRDVSDLIANSTYTETVFHHCTSRVPRAEELRLMDAILIAGLDSTFLSTWPARIVMSRAESLQSAVATGIMSIGSRRGAAAADAARMLQTASQELRNSDVETIARSIVESHLTGRTRIPGIGNPIHKTSDPRADGVIRVARETGLAGQHVDIIVSVSAMASAKLGRAMVVNYSGAVGAVTSDMGWDPLLADGVVLLARTGGVVANVLEELTDPTFPEFSRQLAENLHLIYEGIDGPSTVSGE